MFPFLTLVRGRGNYVQLFDATNGKVFKWVQPDANNIKAGRLGTGVLLVTPKKQQIVTDQCRIPPKRKHKLKQNLPPVSMISTFSLRRINTMIMALRQTSIGARNKAVPTVQQSRCNCRVLVGTNLCKPVLNHWND